MMKLLARTVLASLFAIAMAQPATAAFSINVQSTSGPASFSFMSSSTTSGSTMPGSVVNIFTDPMTGETLDIRYNISHAPGSSTFGFTNPTGLQFLNGIQSPISFTVTIMDDAVINPVPAGTSAFGYTGYSITGNLGSTFSSLTTFNGTGNNTIAIPATGTAPLVGVTTTFPASTFNTVFSAGTSPGTQSIVFTFNLEPNASVRVISGEFGVTPTPAPPALVLGLFAVPTLAMLRRRMAR